MSVIPAGFWILLIVAAVCCSMGFKKFVWFMSIGYGLAVAGIGVTIGVMSIVRGEWSVPFLLFCVLMVVYGFRLGGFLAIRELKNATYKKTLSEATGNDKKMPFPVLFVMWIMMAILYYVQTTPIFYRLANGASTQDSLDVAFYIGFAISICGVVIEGLADKQKSAQKKINPKMAATQGLFKMCRCPNYFGEILFWTGLVVSSIMSNEGVQWIVVAIGYVMIVYIMFDGAKRLEKRQNKNYGDIKEYQEYVKKTPIIIPLIPLYHLVKEENKQ